MVNKYSLWGVIVGGVVSIFVLLFLFWWMFLKVSYIVYSEDTVINGDFVVTQEQPIMLRDNAKLTIKGDAVLAGEVACKSGGINLEVEGFLSIADEINCATDPEEVGVDASGVMISAVNGLVMGQDATITSAGSVQIVDNQNKVVLSQEEVDALFDSVDQVEASGIQIGPLSDEDDAQEYDVPKVEQENSTAVLPFVEVANAQEEFSGGKFDWDAFADRIEKSQLNEAQKAELKQILSAGALGMMSFGKGYEDIAKNSVTALSARRFLDDVNIDWYKELFSDPKKVNLTPSDVDYLDKILIDYIQSEGKKKPVIISGTFSVGKGEEPPEDLDVEDSLKKELDEKRRRPKKVILNFDFSEGDNVALSNINIRGPRGVDASGGFSADCNVKGDDGGDAMRFNVRAPNLRIGNFKIEMGSGGNGATVGNGGFCDNANVVGGNGGKPGNIKMHASQNFEITGEFTIIPGEGGKGGAARAGIIEGEDGCNGKDAGKAEAIGGNGGHSKQKLKLRGTIGGSGSITIGAAIAGDGGDAIAIAFEGGNGSACGCAGGKGGNAIAKGGNGGDARKSSAGLNFGGDGGDAIAEAGDGGYGGSCKKDEGPAGAGGNGGDAFSTPGKGGDGDIPGADGGADSEALAGDGGVGGDGCLEGKGGKMGQGKGGLDAEDGKRICSAPPQEEENLISIAGATPGSMYEIEAIAYKGAAIPTFLVHEADPDKCSGNHWHGGGTITMINGETTKDPAIDGCGFGETSQVKAIWVPVDHEKMKQLYGDSVDQYLRPVGGAAPNANAPAVNTEIRIEGGITGGERVEEALKPSDEGCLMVELCQEGFGAWVTCSGQEDRIAHNQALGCEGF